jgi:hypothetical protein
MDVALNMIPTVILESNVRSLQCLVLLSIYYQCLLKPCYAHEYALIASFKAQNVLKSNMYAEDPMSLELVRRAYWAILLIESELNVQLDLAESGIWKHDDIVSLPSGHETWHFVANSPQGGLSTSPESVASAGSTSDEMLTYFLAEISMRRMLQRCTTSSVSNTSHGRLVYAPIIATELKLQLDEWHGYLPSILRFEKDMTSDLNLATGPLSKFLRTQYMACKASIYWPAVYQVMEHGEADSDILLYCAKFFESYKSFVAEATSLIHLCRPNTWTLYTRFVVCNGGSNQIRSLIYPSVFIITMAALKAISTPCLMSVLPLDIQWCFEATVTAFDEICSCSPSLAALQGILRNSVHVQMRVMEQNDEHC